MRILVTGGAGYIGSHTCLQLLAAGHDVVIVDNLVNSKQEAVRRMRLLAGRDFAFHRVDLLDSRALHAVFADEGVEAVIHFAGLKAVGESVVVPLRYYENNLVGTLNLCAAMQTYDVRRIVFSSSATVYGDPQRVPIEEGFPLQPTNPYGRTKLMIEQILGDLQQANTSWSVILLRYFNPVGAHPSGQIGEDPNDIPNNLMPIISQVAVGRLKRLQIYGNDYPTPDGTGVRDYIHVEDLAAGHLAALERMQTGVAVYNLGTGRGYSVMEMLAAFEAASGVSIPHEVVGRRAGDIATCYADATRARRELGWAASRQLADMCADNWRWQSQNPNGYPAG